MKGGVSVCVARWRRDRNQLKGEPQSGFARPFSSTWGCGGEILSTPRGQPGMGGRGQRSPDSAASLGPPGPENPPEPSLRSKSHPLGPLGRGEGWRGLRCPIPRPRAAPRVVLRRVGALAPGRGGSAWIRPSWSSARRSDAVTLSAEASEGQGPAATAGSEDPVRPLVPAGPSA